MNFLLVPNHSIFLRDRRFSLELAEVDLLKEISLMFSKVGIAAIKERNTNSSVSGKISSDDATLYRLNVFEHKERINAKIANYFYAIFAMLFPIIKHDFIYIFCPGFLGLIASFWAVLLKKKYAFYVRGTWLTHNFRTPLWWQFFFHKASFIIATGEAFRSRIQVYNNNVLNEVPLTSFKPEKFRGLRKKNNNNIFRCLFVGRLIESKGIYDAMRAIAILQKKSKKEIELIIAGGGTKDEFELVKKLSHELKIHVSTRILGHIEAPQLVDLYHKSDVFIFPSYFKEGFPRVLYEAMMFGLAIVTVKMPGVDGFLVNGKNCMYCEPRDPNMLADILLNLVMNPWLCESLGKTAKEDVLRVFSKFSNSSHGQQLIAETKRVLIPQI